jgi:polysaccharide export outer membrane protein
MKYAKFNSNALSPLEDRRWAGLAWPGIIRASATVLLVLAMFAPRSLMAQSPRIQEANTNVTAMEAITKALLTNVSTNIHTVGLGSTTNLSATNVSATLGTNQVASLDDQYKLAIGDHVSFRIIEDEDDPKDLLVTDTGEIEVPYLGRYPVVGKTCKQLAAELKARLEEKYYYQATVMVFVDSKLTPGLVYLVGPVRTPGPMELPRDETLTLSKAILRAGGFADLADEKHVRITREGPGGASDHKIVVVDVYAILNEGQTDKDMVLEPGDLIYIPERMLRF